MKKQTETLGLLFCNRQYVEYEPQRIKKREERKIESTKIPNLEMCSIALWTRKKT